jgi:hypothetical protein
MKWSGVVGPEVPELDAPEVETPEVDGEVGSTRYDGGR